MCGISGFLSSAIDYNSSSGELLLRMAKEISYRGPDDTGIWIDSDKGISFAHCRLAIQDLSPAGHQPMVSHSGRYVIIFNGEIYNHLALRENLSQLLTISWSGHSDTETLLAGFETWGISDTIKKCVGMFAFAVWDKDTCNLTLGRDRLGEKPLYYGWQKSGATAAFLFGSELKALRAHPAFNAEIDRNSLALFMRHASVPAPYSIYKGIFKLNPGTLLTLSLANPDPTVEVYWSGVYVAAAGVASPFCGNDDDAVNALDTLLISSVKQQMISDVPLGAFLSGGVDSSAIVALMQAQSSRPVKTFSIGFNEAQYDEAVYAKSVANHLGTDHTELYLTPNDAMSVIPRLSSIYDEPFADSSQIPTFLVSQLAKNSVTVSLSGDAGDELFGGYNRYQVTNGAWNHLSKCPYFIRRSISKAILGISPQTWDKLLGNTSIGNRWAGFGHKLHKGAAVLDARSAGELYCGLVSQWNQPEELVIGAHEPPTLLTDMQIASLHLNDVEKMMLLDMLTYLPDDILTKVDRAAMAVSLESRVPFLDHRVVEFAWSLPLAFKLRKEAGGYKTKWALRQVLYRYVPKELIERPKMGFGVPIDSWLRGPLKSWAEELLDETLLRKQGYFNSDLIRKRWLEHQSGVKDWQHSLWCVLMFQAWLSEIG